jgi:hypothetical protein
MHELRALLGDPIATRGDRLAAWDLGRARPSLLAGMSANARRALAQKMLDAPQLYVTSDADPLTDRGGKHDICASATITIVNPGPHTVREDLDIVFRQRESSARDARVAIRDRIVKITAAEHAHGIRLHAQPGVTKIKMSVDTPGVRCQSVPDAALPSISVTLHPDHGRRSIDSP